ncbi:hypothetical protein [Alteribacter natronophilus]|uniref:hypothetical protein n=1 Tax=Alteribacter natronophilus TaxID=2583810 RepID=UPI00110DE45C|nr:hypothetical protein [Alteribacter natronophilus]TMW72270.1 hypothetical protein FGB90_08650 [Alteribacter natronophilus]
MILGDTKDKIVDVMYSTNPLMVAYHRLPWLVFFLFVSLRSSGIVSGFEDTLESGVALAFFTPMVAG